MPQYISQMRRGVRYVDENGATLLNDDGTPVRDDWAEYTTLPFHIPPMESELVVEYEVNQQTGKRLPRLKIGDGVSEFADLEYVSVDSFILPKTASIYLNPNTWELMPDDDGDRYCQVVTVQNAVITPNSKVDLTPSSAQLDEFRALGLVFVAENEDGVVKVCCLGNVPTNAYTVSVAITEVICNA